MLGLVLPGECRRGQAVPRMMRLQPHAKAADMRRFGRGTVKNWKKSPPPLDFLSNHVLSALHDPGQPQTKEDANYPIPTLEYHMDLTPLR
jgi:hypothetical protein